MDFVCTGRPEIDHDKQLKKLNELKTASQPLLDFMKKYEDPQSAILIHQG